MLGILVVVGKLKGMAEGTLFGVVVVSGTAAFVTDEVVGSGTLVVVVTVVVDTGTVFSVLALDVVGATVVVVGGIVVPSVVCAVLTVPDINCASDANDSCILELSVGKMFEGRSGDVYNLGVVVVGTVAVVVSTVVCVVIVVTVVILTGIGVVVGVATVAVFAFAGDTETGVVVIGTDVVVSVLVFNASEVDETGESIKLS